MGSIWAERVTLAADTLLSTTWLDVTDWVLAFVVVKAKDILQNWKASEAQWPNGVLGAVEVVVAPSQDKKLFTRKKIAR